MSNNILKTLFICFVLFFSALFINVDGVKANNIAEVANGKGYADCEYEVEFSPKNASTTQLKPFVVRITAFQNKNGNYDAYVITACGNVQTKNGNSQTTLSESQCSIKDFKGLFYNSAKNRNHFTTGGSGLTNNDPLNTSNSIKWKCPTLYANVSTEGNVSNEMELSFESKGSPWEKMRNTVNVCPSSGIPTSHEGDYDGRIAKSTDELIEGNREEAGLTGDNDIEKIEAWGSQNKNREGEYGIEDVGDVCGPINSYLGELITTFLWIIDIIAIILLIIMTMVNFIQALTGMDDEKLRNTFKYLRNRIVAVVVLLLLPVLVGWIIETINENSGGVVMIGADGQPFCGVENK